MDITDAPYAAGTPEHGEWVRNVFIPTVEPERLAIEGALVGAESQGRQLTRGKGYWEPLWRGTLEELDDEDADKTYVAAGFPDLTGLIEKHFERLVERLTFAATSFTFLMEEFVASGWVAEPKREPTLEEIIANVPEEHAPAAPLWLTPEFKRLPALNAQASHEPPPWREPWRRR